MNVDDMTDQEKSVLLARAMGESCKGRFRRIALAGNLYHAANMAFAWRVLNWAYKQRNKKDKEHYWMWVMRVNRNVRVDLPPADAQRLWLDKVLELAIEAGLVDAA